MTDRDIFEGSSAWRRLNERSPKGWTEETIALKHDVTSVLQTMLGAIQVQQALLDEMFRMQTKRDTAQEKMYAELFNPDKGSFAMTKKYTDGKLTKLYNLGWAVLGSSITLFVTIIAQLVIKK